MTAPRHWLISKTNRNSSMAEAISFTSALKSIGFFLRLRIGNSFKNATTVFRHDLEIFLRDFRFAPFFMGGRAKDATDISHQGYGGYYRG